MRQRLRQYDAKPRVVDRPSHDVERIGEKMRARRFHARHAAIAGSEAQMVLLVGYAYADFTTRRLTPKRQAILHVALLVISLLYVGLILAKASTTPLQGANL